MKGSFKGGWDDIRQIQSCWYDHISHWSLGKGAKSSQQVLTKPNSPQFGSSSLGSDGLHNQM